MSPSFIAFMSVYLYLHSWVTLRKVMPTFTTLSKFHRRKHSACVCSLQQPQHWKYIASQSVLNEYLLNECMTQPSSIQMSINVFPPKKQKKKEFTHRNIKNPVSYQGTQNWKGQFLSKRSQAIQKAKEAWLSVLGLRTFITFHQGETTERNERSRGRVPGTKEEGKRGILHRRSIYSIKVHETWKVKASRLSMEFMYLQSFSNSSDTYLLCTFCISVQYLCGHRSKHYRQFWLSWSFQFSMREKALHKKMCDQCSERRTRGCYSSNFDWKVNI